MVLANNSKQVCHGPAAKVPFPGNRRGNSFALASEMRGPTPFSRQRPQALARPTLVLDRDVIEATGLPLGLFDDANYDEFRFKMKAGDTFVFFSDGILDARSRRGELFGRHGIEKLVAKHAGESAEFLVDTIFNAVDEHSAGMESFDDQTVVAIKVKDSASPAKRK